MTAAKAYAELSYARRLKVGAVIVRDDRVVSIGYNGTPSGRDNNCEVEVQNHISYWNDDGTEKDDHPIVLKSKPEVCHAEMNAIMFAAKHGMSTDGCDLIVTHSPCFECSKMIVQAGLKNVYYEIEYRDMSSVDFLKECNIKVEKV
jgi:dCMP deaminase